MNVYLVLVCLLPILLSHVVGAPPPDPEAVLSADPEAGKENNPGTPEGKLTLPWKKYVQSTWYIYVLIGLKC